MKQLTRNQNATVSAIISYPEQADAAAALGVAHGTLRNTLTRARKRVDAHNTPQLIYKWTLAQIAEQVTSNI